MIAALFERKFAPIDQCLIEELRTLVYDYAHAHPDKIDLEDVRNRIRPPGSPPDQDSAVPDWILKKSLISAIKPYNLDSALDRFVEIFQNRAAIRMSSLRLDNCMPLEFYSVNPVYMGPGRDREGNLLVTVRVKFYRRDVPQFDLFIKRAAAFLAEQEDLRYERHATYPNVTILVDCSDFNLWQQASIDMIKYCLKLGLSFPTTVRRLLIHSFPWGFGFLVQMADVIINTCLGINDNDSIQLVDSESILKWVERDQLPHYLNGGTVPKEEAPEGVMPLEQMAALLKQEGVATIEDRNLQRILEHVQNCLA